MTLEEWKEKLIGLEVEGGAAPDKAAADRGGIIIEVFYGEWRV